MLSLYTKIPMPFLEWTPRSTRYVLTWLPLSGLLIGAAEAGWFLLAFHTGLHEVLYAAVSCALPLAVNGGIHLDGLADTADACASHAPAEKRREILSDPHTGAFGAGAVVIYEIMMLGIFCQLWKMASESSAVSMMLLLLICFIVPRALTQIAAAVISPAVERGILFTMTSSSSRGLNLAAGLVILVLCAAAAGSVLHTAVFLPILALLLFFLYFGRMTKKGFGGISGDLCGWLIKMSELVYAGALIPALCFLFNA